MINRMPDTKTRRMHMKPYIFFVAIALLFTMLGLTLGYSLTTRAEPNEEAIQIETREKMSPADLYEACVDSTVGITTSETINVWGFTTPSAAAGSGFILSEDGYILTNYHVIAQSDSITVSTNDGEDYKAKLIGFDRGLDIALLKIEAEDLQAVVIGDSDEMRVGDDVLAIGNPLGELTFSLTTGVVSALGREITVGGGVMMDLIQTDAAINSGNSGGALFNAYGEVIGITNAKYSSSGMGREASVDNIGFAIPMNNVRGLIETLIEKGYIAKPYIGILVSDVSTEMKAYGLPEGAVIHRVEEDSPAEEAGLEEMDIILSVNGRELESTKELLEVVRKAKADDELELEVFRKGEKLKLTVVVSEQRKSSEDMEKERQQEREREKETMPDMFPWNFGFGRP